MRARNIKPGFYKNADLAECSIAARFLAPGLWMIADKEGRLQDRPKQIKGEIFPYDDINIDQLLDELVRVEHIIRYEVGEKRFIQITKFGEHQRPHSNETPSSIPSYIQHITEKEKSLLTKVESPSEKIESTSSLTTDLLIPDSLNAESLPNGNSARTPEVSDYKKPKSEKPNLETLSVDHNAEWLARKRSEGHYCLHDEHFVLEQFKQYCRSKGKKYADYLEAYRNAFEWEKCQPKQFGKPENKDDRTKAAILRGLGIAAPG